MIRMRVVKRFIVFIFIFYRCFLLIDVYGHKKNHFKRLLLTLVDENMDAVAVMVVNYKPHQRIYNVCEHSRGDVGGGVKLLCN